MNNASPTHREALFISHASPEDNAFVRWLGAKLSAMGYEVWADVMNLSGGSDWSRELEQALRERAIKMLLVCTPAGLQKQGVRNEIEIAATLATKLGDTAFIIPLRIESYDPPFRIAQAQYVDFSGGWASGLVELAGLLEERRIPKAAPQPMDVWLATQASGADRLLTRSEPLVSNWLEVYHQPEQILFCEPLTGSSLERFQSRVVNRWPVVAHRTGVVTFAVPAADAFADLPSKVIASMPTEAFLNEGWADCGIDVFQARRMYTDLGAQGFDKLCKARGLTGYVGTGDRISWWGDIKTAPIAKVRFDWNFRRGLRQIIGQSAKRGVHWHYAINAQLRVAPLPHLRLSARLVFTANGMDAITDVHRAHTLRRSFAKGWRNPRWRDMLCAYLWWLGGGKDELLLPVGPCSSIGLTLPPMQFGCPVSVSESIDDADEDDPDVPVDIWDDPIDGLGEEK